MTIGYRFIRYLLVEKGMMFIKQMYLERLAKDQIYEFVFIASSLKLRDTSAVLMGPIAIRIQ